MKSIFNFSLLLAVLLIAGCSDDPSSIGLKQIPAGDRFSVVDTTIPAASYQSYRISDIKGYGQNVLVGKSGATNAIAIMHFFDYLIPDEMDSIAIDTVRLTLRISYNWPSAAKPSDYVIRQVLTSWTEADSNPTLQFSTETYGQLSDTMVLGQDVTFTLDPKLIKKWLEDRFDTSAASFYGFSIEQKSTSAEGGIWGFTSLSMGATTSPQLEIIYTKDSVHSSYVFQYGTDTYLLNDTSSASGLSIQGAVAKRCLLKFDVSSIPRDAIINNAEIHLYLKNATLSSNVPDTLVAILSTKDTIPDQTSFSFYGYGARKDQTERLYVFSYPLMTNIVQRWISAISPNYGVALRMSAEAYAIDRYEFYAPNDSVAAVQPKLVITYTKK